MYVPLLLPMLFLAGCMTDAGGNFDVTAVFRNPFVMGVIIIAVLWYVFTHRHK